jgi:HSP20 family molecular chaperone IbpA
MFKKKKCAKCENTINDKYDFCPHCGNSLANGSKKQEDFGMLGKNDFFADNNIKLPMGFNTIFNTLVKSLGKELNKEFSEMNKQMNKQNKKPGVKKSGVSIRISTSGNKPPEIKIDSFGDNKQNKKKLIKEIPQKKMSLSNIKKIRGLPKTEPTTNIKRLGDKVIYEIDIPGVTSTEDISIMKFENSIEIKALTKDKAYVKLIPINLPVTNYELDKGKLILELGQRE